MILSHVTRSPVYVAPFTAYSYSICAPYVRTSSSISISSLETVATPGVLGQLRLNTAVTAVSIPENVIHKPAKKRTRGDNAQEKESHISPITILRELAKRNREALLSIDQTGKMHCDPGWRKDGIVDLNITGPEHVLVLI